MNDQDLKTHYSLLLDRHAHDERGRCLDPEALMDIADGSASGQDRIAGLMHVSACPACKRDLALCRTVAEADVMQVRRSRRGLLAAAASLAVIAAGATLVIRMLGPAREDIMRGSAAVSLVQPANTVTPEVARRLVWRLVPKALRYEAEVLDHAGGVVFSATVADTTAVVPPATPLELEAPYSWRVTAVMGDGSRQSSAARPFLIQAR